VSEPVVERRTDMARLTTRAILFATAAVAAVAQPPAPPARAQEVVSILNQKEWSVAGVGIAADEYGTCAATDASHADASIWLQVTETPGHDLFNEVSVMHPGDPQATAAVLQIGGDRFVLAATEGDRFFSAANDGARIVAAMLKDVSLTLQFEGVSAPKPYSYDLAEFPAAYAALAQHCHAPANP
jgi:hypothetical protein